MNQDLFSKPMDLRSIQITDEFWKKEMELVRNEVIPYQWDALNDNVKDAAPSYCMHNFRAAAKLNQDKQKMGKSFVAPTYTFRGFEALPEDLDNPDEDKFYGFVFQDTDFSKWIEAVGYSLTQHPDENLEKIADEAIELVCQAQAEDGYLDTYYIINGRDKTFSNLRDHHELYCLGHLTEGAVAYYQATGKDKLLKAAMRFADYVDNYFGEEKDKCKGYPGHEIAEMALVRLYEVTNDDKYFKLAKFFVDERGKRPYYFDSEHPEVVKKGHENEIRYDYHQAHKPVREQDEAVGHAVRAVYLYSGMADVARISGDEKLLDACNRLWDSITKEKMYITGGIGSSREGEAFTQAYDLPNDAAYAETCASIGLIFFARRMLQIKPDSKYADVMERALYNGVLSGMALDGKSFFYVNPLEVNPEACHRDSRKSHVKPVRQKWFGCACCPPNIARLLSSIGSYAYTENEDTLFVHLYIGGKIQKNINDRNVDIMIESEFPWNGAVKVKVRAKDTNFKLALRLPDWATDYQVDGADGEIKDGYLYIQKQWDDEDIVSLNFNMETFIWESDTRVRENIGKAAVTRGPIVYCLEEKDNGSDLHTLKLNPEGKIVTEMSEIQNEKFVKLIIDGYREESNTEKLYNRINKHSQKNTELKFIPYYLWANRGENEMSVWVRL